MDIIITKEEFVRIGVKTTVCCLTLQNGFEVVGTSAFVDPTDYDLEVGKEWAKKAALSKLDEYDGFLRQQRMYCKKEK